MAGDEPDVSISSVTMTLRQGEDVVLRQIALGLTPLVLIEPVQNEDGSYGFDIDATFMTREELGDLFEILLGVVRDGEAVPVESEDPESNDNED